MKVPAPLFSKPPVGRLSPARKTPVAPRDAVNVRELKAVTAAAMRKLQWRDAMRGGGA